MSSSNSIVGRKRLYDALDDMILKGGLAELHTHLAGMGSADFWVTRIMEGYLMRTTKKNEEEREERKEEGEGKGKGKGKGQGKGKGKGKKEEEMKEEVYYDIDSIFDACGLEVPKEIKAVHAITDNGKLESIERDYKLAILEPMMFSRVKCDLHTAFKNVPLKFKENEEYFCISNTKLVELMEEERRNVADGPLVSMVRNWFQFLNLNGSAANENEIMRICKYSFNLRRLLNI